MPQVVLITGAAGGIGAALARRFAHAGARLALVDRDGDALLALAEDIGATAYVADLTELHALPTLVDGVVADHGGLDVLINNAGITVQGTFEQLTVAQIHRVLDLDLRAVMLLTHAALPHLRRSSAPHIVLMSSMAGGVGFPTQTTYAASKFGVRGFGQSLRIELAGQIGVTTVLPGTIATGFLERAETHDADNTRQLARLMTRYGTSPDRVARAVERGIAWNRGEVRVGWDSHLVGALTRWTPWLLPFVLRRAFARQALGRS